MAKKDKDIYSEKEQELLFMTLQHMEQRQFTQEETERFVKLLKTSVTQCNDKNLFKVTQMITPVVE